MDAVGPTANGTTGIITMKSEAGRDFKLLSMFRDGFEPVYIVSEIIAVGANSVHTSTHQIPSGTVLVFETKRGATYKITAHSSSYKLALDNYSPRCLR